ncbi:sepiapterin reductase-like protein [Backusella circina FSU 941]|nr:sepiapterin reductase-like protein [Backusella circina FSU 941]
MLLPHTLYVVTGANRGFGKVIAETIANKATTKTTLVLVGRQEAPLNQLKTQLASEKVSCHVLSQVNLETAEQAEKTVTDRLGELIKSWQQDDGIAPLTKAVLINNAGTTGDLSKTVDQYTPTEIQQHVSHNIASYISLVSGFINLFENSMIDVKIVNISSLLAVKPFANWGLYGTSKAARHMLLQVIAQEKQDIKVLSYSPGPLDNEMQQHVRDTLGDPEQQTFFKDMANKGDLVKMDASAAKLLDLLEKDDYLSGAHIDYFD